MAWHRSGDKPLAERMMSKYIDAISSVCRKLLAGVERMIHMHMVKLIGHWE